MINNKEIHMTAQSISNYLESSHCDWGKSNEDKTFIAFFDNHRRTYILKFDIDPTIGNTEISLYPGITIMKPYLSTEIEINKINNEQSQVVWKTDTNGSIYLVKNLPRHHKSPTEFDIQLAVSSMINSFGIFEEYFSKKAVGGYTEENFSDLLKIGSSKSSFSFDTDDDDEELIQLKRHIDKLMDDIEEQERELLSNVSVDSDDNNENTDNPAVPPYHNSLNPDFKRFRRFPNHKSKAVDDIIFEDSYTDNTSNDKKTIISDGIDISDIISEELGAEEKPQNNNDDPTPNIDSKNGDKQ